MGGKISIILVNKDVFPCLFSVWSTNKVMYKGNLSTRLLRAMDQMCIYWISMQILYFLT